MTIHVPLTAETKNLFNAKSISEMKNDAVVLNMGRGGIVRAAHAQQIYIYPTIC